MSKIYMLEPHIKTRGRLMSNTTKITFLLNDETCYDFSNLKQYDGRFGILVEDNGVEMPVFFTDDMDSEAQIPIEVEINIKGEWKEINLIESKVTSSNIQIVLV
jgi:hypothetical protein